MEESLAAMLRRTRVERGLTQEALAEQAGLSPQAISLLERGVRQFPHAATLDKLDQVLGFTDEERALVRRLASRGAASSAPAAAQAGPAWSVAHGPRANAVFTGRRAQLDRLADLLTSSPTRAGAPTVATIRGMAGVGKTALAIQAAGAASKQFPDGVLSVNLRGFGPGAPLGSLQAIAQLLRQTGVPAEAVPDDLAQAAAALRTRLAGRRVLLLLDNARDVEQISDLIPAAESSAVLITSRNTLTTLPASLHLQLAPLAPAESTGLLATIAGTDRLADSADRIADLCGHLPLALSIAAAWLVEHAETSAADLARRLEDESHRLDHLGAEDLDIRVSLSHSIDQLLQNSHPLDQRAAQAFTLLGLTDAHDFTAETAAPLLDTPQAEADGLLERLTDLHLLESPVPGRYQFHDLVRSFARERAGALPSSVREAALDRSLHLYLAAAWRTTDLTDPGSARLAWAGRPTTSYAPEFTEAEQALGWLDNELGNCLALINQFGARGARDEQVAGLVIGLYNYFVKRGNLVDWLPAIERAAAGRVAEWTLGQLQADAAIALAELARYDESAARFVLARDHFAAAGSPRGLSLATNNHARLLLRMHRHEEALPLVERALAANKSLGNDRAIAANYLTLSEIQVALGDHAAAEAYGVAAQEHFQAAGDADGVANARIESAWARVNAGRPASAVADIQRSILELERLGHRKNVSDAYYVLGLTAQRIPRLEAAIESTERALEIAIEVSDHRREAQARLLLGQLLTQIGEPEDAVPNLRHALDFYREHDQTIAARAEELLLEARKSFMP